MPEKIPFDACGKIYMVDYIAEHRISGVGGVARTGIILPEFADSEDREKRRLEIVRIAAKIYNGLTPATDK